MHWAKCIQLSSHLVRSRFSFVPLFEPVQVCVAVRFKILHVRYLRIHIYVRSNLVRKTLDRAWAYFKP